MSANIFNSVQVKKPQTSKFDLSHSFRASCKMGELVPFMFIETVPGDYFELRSENLVRFASLSTPVMETFDLQVDYFFVPYRYLWEGFEDFFTGKSDAIPPQVTNIDEEGLTFRDAIGSLTDYFGLPLQDHNDDDIKYSREYGTSLNMYGWLAYQKIWFDWYRDQNHQYPNLDWFEDFIIPKGGHEYLLNKELEPTIYAKYFQIRRRAWAHDYFTSALPWAQRGNAVTIPIGSFDDVPVANRLNPLSGDFDPTLFRTTDDTPAVTASQYTGTFQAPYGSSYLNILDDDLKRMALDAEVSGFYAKTSNLVVGSATIDELNRAYRIQEWLQLSARAGQRYVEQVFAVFDTYTEDYRLARAHFIGGVKTPVVVSEVLQTSGNQENDPNGFLGDYGGRMISADDGKFMKYHCKEHGAIIGIYNIQSRATYAQGIDRKFLRRDKFDLATPLLAQLGERPVFNMELYLENMSTKEDNESTFGYQSMYADWKYERSVVAGEFRTSLDDWTYYRKFADAPELDEDFLTWSNDNRIFNVTEDIHNCYVHFMNWVTVSRKLPFYGTPVI